MEDYPLRKPHHNPAPAKQAKVARAVGLARLTAACFFLLILFSTPAQAARICVPSSFDGSCNASQATLTAAITAATSGVDNIYVQAGTYSQRINFGGKNITIQSAAGAAATIIQGDNTNNPVVTFATAEGATAILDGFTIDNQAVGNTLTRGITISGASPTIKNSIIQGNNAPNATDGGGGVYVDNGAPSFDYVTIRANSALNRSGCGMYIKGAAGGATITNSTIGGTASGDGNLCTNGSGGGIYYIGSTTGTLTISNSNIQYNQGNANGGGIFATTITNPITITNSTVLNNFTGTNGDGGGIYIMTNTPLSFTGGSVRNNISRSGVGFLVFNGADLTISGNTVIDNNDTNNCTSGDGGGIYATSAGSTVTMTGGSITNNAGRYGSGIYVTASASVALAEVTITGNSSACGSNNGGGIHANGGTLTADRCKIRGNSGLNGGGVYALASATVTIRNSDITGNVATTDGGGALVSGTTTLNIYNSTVAGNYAGGASNGGGGVRNNAATCNLTNAIVSGNLAAAAGKQGISTSGTTNINFSSYQAISGTCSSCGNNRAVGEDPLFMSLAQAGAGSPTTGGNFHLQATSPVINQGTNNGYTPDIDGDPRAQGSGYEMGSDEVVPVGSNSTTVGVATAASAGVTAISVSMPYTDDINDNNTYAVDYKLTSEPTVWSNWVTAAAHTVSPYATTITGLTEGSSYEVRVTYNDADGVTGTNPQTISGVVPGPIIRAVPSVYPTIQAAIDASNHGDIVLVADGTYAENINFNNKLVTVISQNGAALTTIQGTGANAPVVTFASGETASAMLDGFTIDNQAAGNSLTRGISISGSSPTIKNSIIQGNNAPNATDGGGGVYVDNGAPSFDYVTIRANSALNRSGCGMYIKGAAGGATITNSTIGGTASGDGNLCTNGSGGGIYYTGSTTGTLTISNSNIQYNQGNANGGGIFATTITNPITITNSTVLNNFTGTNGDGGGIYLMTNTPLSFTGGSVRNNIARSGSGFLVFNGADLTITGGTTIDNNDTNNCAGGGDGGGIYATSAGSTVTMTDGSITNNAGRWGGGIYLTSSASVALTGVTINSNSGACVSPGGGIHANGGTLTADRVKIRGNSASHGGGVFLATPAVVTIRNSDITGNTITAYGGGAMTASAPCTLNIYNSTVAGNYAGGATGGGGIYNTAGTINITNSIIYGNTSVGPAGIGTVGTTTITYSSYQAISGACTGCTNNRAVGENPLLVNLQQAGAGAPTTGGDFHLTGSSPVISQGTNNGYTPDIDGDARTTPYEMGSDEIVVNSTTVGSATAVTASNTSIAVSMPYSSDDNGNNTYTVDYKLTSEPTVWSNWVTAATHTASPYATTITGLIEGESYDVRLTYNDANGVNGTNPQTVSAIVLPVYSTATGVATAVNAGITSISVSMPYSNDSTTNNTYTVDHKLSSEPTVWSNWVTAAAHVASPYLTTITGLIEGESYDVRLTYNDADGVTGTNPQTITAIVTGPVTRAVPSTYPTIQAAIDASNNGDIVLVASGTYAENINFNNKLVTVISQNGAALTTIQGTGANAPVVTFNSGETASAVLDGFTLDNQAAASIATRGIAITAGSAPTLNNLILEGNQIAGGTQQGGAISINGGSATIEDCTLGGNSANKNTAQYGSALYATALSAPLSISNTTISENASASSGALYLAGNGVQTTTLSTVTFTNNTTTNAGGAAIYNDSSSLLISNSEFTTNTTAPNMHAGAIMITGASAAASISNTTFTGNSSGNYGGAIYITGSTAAAPLTISGSTFTNNGTGATYPFYGGAIALNTLTNPAVISSTTITGSHADNRGGGIYATAAPLTLTNVDVTGCISEQEGGGIYLLGASTVANLSGGSITGSSGTIGGGIYVSGATLNSNGTTISGNVANAGGSGTGGGISMHSSSSVSLTKSTVSGNRTNQHGGGIFLASGGGTLLLTNTNVTGNSADMQSYSSGGGIKDLGGTVTLMNTTVAGNFATSSAGGFAAAGADDLVTNAILWGNNASATPEISGTPTVSYSDVAGGFAGSGNLNSNPLFVSLAQASSGTPTSAGNFHLQSTSPAKNAGTASGAPNDDIDGDPRESVDMGADEYPGGAPPSITISGTLYSDEGVTAITSGPTVRLLANGASVGTAVANASGVYSITASVNAGTALLAYIDTNGSVVGNAVTVASSADLSGLDIYANRLITRHDNGGTLTNALLATANGAYADTDILYSVSGGNLTATGTDTELLVWPGHALTPGGTLTCTHLDINGTLDAAAHPINVAGNWEATGGVFTSSGTVTFNAASGTRTITPGGVDSDHDFQEVVVNDAAGSATFQLGGAIKVNGSFTCTDGVFDTTGANHAVTIGGALSDSVGGRFKANGSTITVGGDVFLNANNDVSESTDFNAATLVLNGAASNINYSNLNAWYANGFNNLTVGQGGVIDTLNYWLTVKGTLTIGSGGLTSPATTTLALSKAGDALSFDAASTLSIDTLMFIKFGGGQNLPPLTTGYGCNISIAGGSSVVVTQTGNVTLNSGKNLLIRGDGDASRAQSLNTAGFDLTVGGNLSIGAGSDTGAKTLNGANSTISVGGNWQMATGTNTFTSTGSTVIFNGVNQSLSGNTTFNNLTKSVAAADTLTFAAGSTTTINGAATLQGAASQLLSLRSSTPGTRWNFTLPSGATKDISYVDVQDSDASGSDATKKPINPANSVNNTNNVDWFSNYTISGTVYADEGVTNIGAGKTVRLVVNGASAGSATTNAGGAYSIDSSVALLANTPLLVYVDGDTKKGTTVTASNGSTLSGVDIYSGTVVGTEGYVIVRHDNGGSMTTALMATALGAYSDTDIKYTVSAGALTINAYNVLYIPAGHIFAPGANTSLDSVKILGTFTGGSYTHTVAAHWNASAGTYIANTSTLSFLSRVSTNFTPGASNYYNIVIDANDYFFSLLGNITATNDITFKTSGTGFGTLLTGALTISAKNFIWQSGYLSHASGAVIECSGNITKSGGEYIAGNGAGLTFRFIGSGNSTFNPGSGTHGTIAVNKDTQSAEVSLSTNNLVMAESQSLNINTGIFNIAGRNLNVGAASIFSNTGTLRLQGGETVVNLTNDTDSGTVEYNGTGAYPSLKIGNSYCHLTFTGTGSWAQTASLAVNGDLSITSGTLNSAGQDIALTGNWNNSGTYTSGANIVTLNGANQSITGSTTFNNLTKSVTTADTLTFAADSTTTINGAATLQGAASQLLSLRSGTPGTRWNFTLPSGATKDISYVDVQDSDASGSDATKKPINPTNSTNSGNNLLWFGAPVSGTVYSDEGTTPVGAGKAVRLLINGNNAGTVTTNASGDYTIDAILTAGDTILAYIDDDAGTDDGTTVTVANGSSLSGLNLYKGHVITRHENGGTLSNAIIKAAKDPYVDTDILYSVDDSNNLTINGTGTELYLPAGHSFTPDANVTTPAMKSLGTFNGGSFSDTINGSLELAGGSYTATSGITSVSGDLLFSAGTFTHNSGTVILNGTSGMILITPGDQTLYNIIFNDGGNTATYQLQGALTVANDLTVTDGILDTKSSSNYAINVTRDLTQSGGRVLAQSSTVTVGRNFAGNGGEASAGFNNATLVLTGTGGLTYENVTEFWINGFKNLTVGQGGNTTTLNTQVISVNNDLTVGSGTLTGGANAIQLSKLGNPLIFDQNSRISLYYLQFIGSGAQSIPTLTNGYDCHISLANVNGSVTQLGNITLNAGKGLYVGYSGYTDRIETYNTAGFALTVGGDIQIGSGGDTGAKTLNGSNSTITIGGNWLRGTGTTYFTSTGSTVIFNGVNQSLTGSTTFNNLTKSVTSTDTLTFAAASTTTVTGVATLNGAAGQMLRLRSSSLGSRWNFTLNAGATRNISSVDVKDSDASGSDASLKPINPASSTDSGNTVAWFAADTTPPAAITDLAIGTVSANAMELHWSAPGDDNTTGTASTYDLRYANTPITADNWGSATQVVGEPAPMAAGTLQSFNLTGLDPSTNYYFAIKTSDEAFNWSGISNSPGGTTTGGDDGAVTVVLHPSAAAAGDEMSSYVGGTAATVLDSNDADTSYGDLARDENREARLEMDDSATAGDIQSVQVKAVLKDLDGRGDDQLRLGLLIGGSEFWGAVTHDVSSGYTTYQGAVYQTNPKTEATWSWADIDSLVAMVDDFNGQANYRITELSIEVISYTPDITAPAAIDNLAVTTVSKDSVQLTCTAPGDDHDVGTASSYDIRYATDLIDEGNWLSATQVTGEPTPHSPGTAESFTVTGLTPGTTYYFAIKASDEIPNISPISNVVSVTTLIDHFRIDHSGGALTCQRADITVKACGNADCSALVSTSVGVTLSPADGWIGGNPKTITSGSTTFQLRHTTAGFVTLGVAGSTPAAAGSAQCFVSGQPASCNLEFFSAGFLFDVPNFTSCQTTAAVAIKAVKASDSGEKCIADGGFADKPNTIVKFWSGYVSPDSGAKAVKINGTTVAGASPGTDISLSFDGNAESSLTTTYDDAGSVQLTASYQGSGEEAGLVMTGSDTLVVAPHHFEVQATTDGTSLLNNGTDAGDPKRKAGEGFQVEVTAVCNGGSVTENFKANTELTTVAPFQPAAGTLAGGSIAAASFINGIATQSNVSYSEVGSMTLKATSSNYLSTGTTITGTSAPVGRFTPHHFDLTFNTPPSFTTGCVSGGFTYLGQPFTYATPPVITVTAKNLAGNTTHNYTGNWWKITGASLSGKAYSTATGSLDTALLPDPDPVIVDSGNGVGTLTFSDGGGLAFARSTPVAAFDAEIALSINVSDSDGVSYAGNPAHFGAATAGNGIAFSDGKSIRFGRLRIENAHGSELLGLSMPILAEYYTGAAWVTNTADSCSSLALSLFTLASEVETVAATSNITLHGASTSTPSLNALASGIGSLDFTAPNPASAGYIDITSNLNTLYWLRFDWDGNGTHDNDPRGRATFGIDKGDEKMIFLRESIIH